MYVICKVGWEEKKAGVFTIDCQFTAISRFSPLYIWLPRYKFIVGNMTINKDGRFSKNEFNCKHWVYAGYVGY